MSCILWNSIARKPVVGKLALRMSRPLLHISLVQTCAVRLCELCISCKYICRAAQMPRLVRTYLSRTFSSLVQKEVFFLFFFNSRKIFPTDKMRSVALIILYVKNWPERSKHVQSAKGYETHYPNPCSKPTTRFFEVTKCYIQ